MATITYFMNAESVKMESYESEHSTVINLYANGTSKAENDRFRASVFFPAESVDAARVAKAVAAFNEIMTAPK